MGLLHLQSERSLPSQKERLSSRRKDAIRRMASIVAGRISLILDYLKLRELLMQQQPIRDPLTQLFTGRYMQETLERELRRAARHSHPVAIAILDIDRFQQFNDNYGRDSGDIMLRQFAKSLASCFRVEDVICRYGGEEFVVILPEASLNTIRRRAEQVHKNSKQLRIKANGEGIGGLALSVGIAAFPEHGKTPEALLRAADQALHDAKSLGRDRVVVAHS